MFQGFRKIPTSIQKPYLTAPSETPVENSAALTTTLK